MKEFGATCKDLFRDDEFLALPPEQRHVWQTLIASTLGGRCGIFKNGVAVLAFETGQPINVIASALEVFVELGWLVRDGEYYLILNRVKHNGWNIKWRETAFNEARDLLSKTSLAQKFLDYYSDQISRDKASLSARYTGKQRCDSNQTQTRVDIDSVQTQSQVESDSGLSQPGLEVESSPTPGNTKQSNTKQSNQESPSAETANAVPANPKAGKRIKPEQPSYEEELKRLPRECLPAWQKYEAMVASHNEKTKTVAPSRMRDLLADILNRCEGLPPGAITHGLLQACQGGEDKAGVIAPRYVWKAACSWRASPADGNSAALYPGDDAPELPTVDEALSVKSAYIDPAVAKANGIASLDELLAEQPQPGGKR